MASGMRVSWVGPDTTLYSQSPEEPDFPLNRHLYPRRPGMLGRLLRFMTAYRAAREIKDIDAYYCPDPDSAFVGWWLARRSGGRVVFDLHENYDVPHTVERRRSLWGAGIIGRIIQFAIAFICRRMDIVVGVSKSVIAPFVSSVQQSFVIRNCAPKRLFSGFSSSRGDVEGSFTLMHGTGALGRGTDVVLNAAAAAFSRVRNLRVIVFNSFTEHADGYGEEAFLRRVDQLGIRALVDLREPIPLRSIPAVLQACDAGLIGYGRRLGVGSLPNRLFEYMAAGLAVIAPKYAVEIKAIVEKEGCGLLVDFEDPEDVARAIVFLGEHIDQCQEMGDRGRNAFESQYNWENEVRPLLDQIHEWRAAASG